jgi:chitinase
MGGSTTPRRRRRRLSLVQLVLILAVTAGVGAAGVKATERAMDVTQPSPSAPWYAPYVDASQTPQYPFESLSDNPSNDVVLGFVVASRSGECLPTWGTYYDLEGAGAALDLDRRITRLRQRGGDLIVSFGGMANDELARRCTDDGLHDAYAEVIRRYELSTVDFDVEGAALEDDAANERRARTVKRLQEEARAAKKNLAVWLTLPVSPQGMTDGALGVVASMLAAGVDVAGVNLMTMDYGDSRPADRDMVEATEDALRASERQLDAAYRRAGMPLSQADVWHKLGMTPMVGQNDTPGDVVTVDDAKRLIELSKELGLGRVSMWSLNRDAACGAQLDPGIVSGTCSGVGQERLAFTYVFDTLPGRAADAAAARTAVTSTAVRDDPATSPYPIWLEDKVYEQGDKVTWHRGVYEAKWWSEGDLPDEPVAHEWDTPWRYLGPVMPGDHPAPVVKLRNGTYPAWSVDRVYVKGQRVQVDGIGYEAQWWTRGEHPDPDVKQPWDSPWLVLPSPTRTRLLAR